MTVNISKPSLNLREELAALRNQGGYSEQAFPIDDNLVTNGTFDSDISGWALINVGGSVAWDTSGRAKFSDGDGTNSCSMQNSFKLVIGNTYVLEYELEVVSGTGLLFYAPGISGLTHYEPTGKYSVTFVATATNAYIRLTRHSTHSGTTYLDNISIYETDGTNVIHTTPAGWLPKDVFVDGLLKREGSGWDYTVHTDGTKHWIKPTVAPSATTTTTILGVRA